MPISGASRKDLYNGLAGAIGPANAEVLMSVLPFYELDEVATKGDIALLRAEMNRDIALLRSATKSDIALLRAEMKRDMALLRSEIKGDISSIKGSISSLDDRISRLEAQMVEVRTELRELRKTTYRLSYATLVTIIGAMAAFQFVG